MDAITLFRTSLEFFPLFLNPLPKGSQQWGILEVPSCALLVCTSRDLGTHQSRWGDWAGISEPHVLW